MLYPLPALYLTLNVLKSLEIRLLGILLFILLCIQVMGAIVKALDQKL